jgi:phosphoglycolate phosphatase
VIFNLSLNSAVHFRKGLKPMSCITIQGHSYDADLVIFDKDGTLLDFKETWTGIIKEFLLTLEKRMPVTLILKGRIENALGIFVDEKMIDGKGALAMGTFTECNTLLTYSIYREGVRWDIAQGIVKEVGKQAFSSEVRKKHVQPAQGAIELLKKLKSRGVHSAVATNDKESDALIDMEYIGALPYLDLVIGADSVERSKPCPDMVEKICSSLGKDPRKSILIGDTTMDALLGKNSGVMLTVGVSGIVSEMELAEHMDVVISSLEEIA